MGMGVGVLEKLGTGETVCGVGFPMLQDLGAREVQVIEVCKENTHESGTKPFFLQCLFYVLY